MKLVFEDCIVNVDDSSETRTAVFEAVVNFFGENGCWHPESVVQSDIASLAGPDLLCALLEVLKPDVLYGDE